MRLYQDKISTRGKKDLAQIFAQIQPTEFARILSEFAQIYYIAQ